MNPGEVVGAAIGAAKDFIPLGGVGLGLMFVVVFALGIYYKGMNRVSRDDSSGELGHGQTHRDIYGRLNDHEARLSRMEGRMEGLRGLRRGAYSNREDHGDD